MTTDSDFGTQGSIRKKLSRLFEIGRQIAKLGKESADLRKELIQEIEEFFKQRVSTDSFFKFVMFGMPTANEQTIVSVKRIVDTKDCTLLEEKIQGL